MAHWLHGAEPLLVGHEGKLHSTTAKDPAELYLERCAM